jgi:hypothetical protein
MNANEIILVLLGKICAQLDQQEESMYLHVGSESSPVLHFSHTCILLCTYCVSFLHSFKPLWYKYKFFTFSDLASEDPTRAPHMRSVVIKFLKTRNN